MHQTLDLSRDFSSVCRPHTAGGHSHKAPAISEVMRLPEATGEAYSFATTVTLYLTIGELKIMNSQWPSSLCYAFYLLLILAAELFPFGFIECALFFLFVVISWSVLIHIVLFKVTVDLQGCLPKNHSYVRRLVQASVLGKYQLTPYSTTAGHWSFQPLRRQ